MSDPNTPPETDPLSAEPGEPIDVEFREAEPERPARRGPGWSASLLLASVAAAAGGALGYAGAERMPGLLGGPTSIEAPELPDDLLQSSDLGRETEARLDLEDRLNRQISRLEERLDRAEERLSAPPIRIEEGPGEEVAADLAALQARLSAIEAIEPGEGGVSDAELARSLAGATSRIETLETRLENELARHEREILDLDGNLDELEASFDALREDVRTARTDAEGRIAAAAEAALALSTMDAAARRGQPFVQALEALEQVRPDLRGLEALAPIAETGAPTQDDLVRQFPDMAEAVLSALQPETADSGVMGVAGRLFGDAVQVRREGDTPVLEALEAANDALDEGDLGGAIMALEPVDGPAGEALAGWLQGARDRRSLERTLDTLRLDLMAEDR
ncbi:MAG: hypothetical protein MRY64_00780 [Hyphomonadaceae bacterium]|nr:hypothetical protein [Hyphomonadaceae bacterium]